jgi:hypothetical protein
MFIEQVPAQNLFAPAERDIRFAGDYIALLRSGGSLLRTLSINIGPLCGRDIKPHLFMRT